MSKKQSTNRAFQSEIRQGINNYLLILACSKKKIQASSPIPAIQLYDGVNFRVLKKYLEQFGWPPGLQIKILSAKYGLVDATDLVCYYDNKMDKASAKELNKSVINELRALDLPDTVYVNLGKDYLPAIKDIESVFPDAVIEYDAGPIGMKMQNMKKWLMDLKNDTANIRGCITEGKKYLYFFPDWDDYVNEPFENEDKSIVRNKTYLHQICGDKTPFNGMLLSLSHLLEHKGSLHRFNNSQSEQTVREALSLPSHLMLFGDSGAFSYVGDDVPPFTPAEAAELYERFGFNIGASVDHIPIPEITTKTPEGKVVKRKLRHSERLKRIKLTINNAEEFLKVCHEKNYSFTPLGVIQGIEAKDYVKSLHSYIDMGYKHIALGGLVPRTDKDIQNILCIIRKNIQSRTCYEQENIWLHLFGILRPKLQPLFKLLGVSSFDSASYYRKSWLRSDQNYLAPDGSNWYGTIRIPFSDSKAMLEEAMKRGITKHELQQLEDDCLLAIEKCNRDHSLSEDVITSIDSYGPLLKRKGEENHFSEKHIRLLIDRPWEHCNCPFCKSIGMSIVVFRGANRNKRRGYHNTWVFYHRILHGKYRA